VKDDRLRAVWMTELDRLELDVIRVERLVKGMAELPVEPWEPPAIPGQLPADLAPRAQELLDRQVAAITELARALAAAQKQIAYGGRVADATGPSPSRPVYLDLDA